MRIEHTTILPFMLKHGHILSNFLQPVRYFEHLVAWTCVVTVYYHLPPGIYSKRMSKRPPFRIMMTRLSRCNYIALVFYRTCSEIICLFYSFNALLHQHDLIKIK